MFEICSICERETPLELIEKHHLIPKCKSKRKKYRKMKNKTINVCCDCGNQIHKLFSENELARDYNSLEKILLSEKIQKWINWVQNKNFNVSFKNKKKKG